MPMRKWILFVCIVAVILIVSVAMTRDETDNGWKAHREESMAETRASAPKPVLPEDVATEWVTAYETVRSCYIGQGFDGAPPVGDSFGDGTVPIPIVDLNYPNLQEALSVCGEPSLEGRSLEVWLAEMTRLQGVQP